MRDNKSSLILPIISGICALIVIASFAYPVISIIIAENEGATSSDDVSVRPFAIFLAFVGYLIVNFIGMFFNAALIYAANDHLEGGRPTLATALQGAASRVTPILAWAMVASVVSVIINQLQERLGILGRVLGFLAGTAWAVVTFLVLPVIVIERREPIQAAKRSAQLLRHSWGENLIGRVGFSVLQLIGVAFIIGFVILGIFISPALIVVTGPAALFAFVAMVVVFSAMSTVFQTALYRHAVGLPTGGFDQGMLTNAFTYRKGSGPPAQPPRGFQPPSPGQSAGMPAPMSPPPASPQASSPGRANPLEGPQDWSKLPDQWT